jgi:hypothetical protein
MSPSHLWQLAGARQKRKAKLRLVFSAEELGGRRFTGLPERDRSLSFVLSPPTLQQFARFFAFASPSRRIHFHLERNSVDVQAPAALVS